MKYSSLLIASLLLSACAVEPTKVQVHSPRQITTPRVQGLADLKLDDKTIIVDARPSFLYSMSHVPQSISLQWDDFSQEAPAQKGVLQSDLDSVARRLARLGIARESKVIIVGNGDHGSGQEGRLAWMLSYLGVKDVDFVDILALKGKLDHIDIEPSLTGAGSQKYKTVEDEIAAHARAQAAQVNSSLKPVPSWTPVLDDSLLATRNEVLSKQARFIDVRTRPRSFDQIPMSVIHISWKSFLTPEGRPNAKVEALLESKHISKDQRIILIDDQGLASGEVTMVLRQLGYSRAANYSGGWNDLASSLTK